MVYPTTTYVEDKWEAIDIYNTILQATFTLILYIK